MRPAVRRAFVGDITDIERALTKEATLHDILRIALAIVQHPVVDIEVAFLAGVRLMDVYILADVGDEVVVVDRIFYTPFICH